PRPQAARAGPRATLSGAGRGRADRDAALRHRRRVRAAQGAHPRPARDGGRAEGVRAEARFAGGREGPAPRAAPRRLRRARRAPRAGGLEILRETLSDYLKNPEKSGLYAKTQQQNVTRRTAKARPLSKTADVVLHKVGFAPRTMLDNN